MVAVTITGDALWDRIERAVEKVKVRLHLATSILSAAGIDYAVIGGNAVQMWVAQVDEAAVRNTRDVDLLLNRSDLPQATEVMRQNGFHYRHARGVDMFLDGPEASARDAVHVIFAEEKVKPLDLVPTPAISEVVMIHNTRVVSLPALVRMKLTAFRDKDRTHLRDLLELGLIDASWLDQIPEPLRPRLQELIETPEG